MRSSSKASIFFALSILTLQFCQEKEKKIKMQETTIVKSVKGEKYSKKTDRIKDNEESAPQIQFEPLSEDALNKISIPIKNNDSLLYLTANIKADHRIFGYSRPDINSKKLILFSIFTNEVENNPLRCKYGSYYDIDRYNQKFILKYRRPKGNFIEVELKDSLGKMENIYFEKKWIILN